MLIDAVTNLAIIVRPYNALIADFLTIQQNTGFQ
jgi:hypothetical protein